jgi:DNA-directed RNA polymerase subunit RPC12/RpoP
MAQVITYQCPRCKADIGRRFGLITKKLIVCQKCGHNVLIDSSVIQQNWAFNFGWMGTLFVWLCLGATVLVNEEVARSIGGKSFKADTVQSRLVIAAVCAIPSLLVGLVIGGVGMALGAIVGASSSANQISATPQGLPQGFPSQQSSYTPPEPQGRGCLIRGFFICFWPNFFLFPAIIIMAGVEGAFSAPSEEVRKQLSEQSAQKNMPWIMGVTLLLFIAGCLGLLPWTGRGKKKSAPPPVEPPPRATDWGRY